MAEIELEKKDILEKVYWTISLRYIAVGIVMVLGAVGAIAARAYLPLISGFSLAVIVLLYNSAGYLYLKRKEVVFTSKQIIFLCFAQLLADIIVITFLIHVTGGVLSPFVLMYLFPIAIISLAAPQNPRFAQATGLFVILFYGSLLTLEYYQVLRPLLVIQQGKEVYQDINLTFYFLLIFPAFVIIAIFLATNMAGYLAKGKKALEQRILELNGVRKHHEEALGELGKKTSEVSILYEITARGVFPLDYFVSRLAEMMRAETVEIILFEDQNKPSTAATYGFPAPAITPKAVLDVPLLHENKKIGELKLTRFREREFSEDEKRILIIIADRLARETMYQQEETQRLSLEKELREKLVELQEFHDLAVGREIKMIELEKGIEKLKAQREKK